MQENETAIYLFHEGCNFNAYKYLGAHKTEDGYVFRVWAPNADEVELVCDINGWGESKLTLNKISEGGIWEVKLSHTNTDSFFYKFKIRNKDKTMLKSDPYAFFSETEGKSASIFWNPSEFDWTDKEWIKYTEKLPLTSSADSLPIPMNIYEIHLGSFYKDESGRALNYREYADIIAPYVKRMGYTHIELMPISEHPYGGSWGYQITGYYSPTSRYGTPDDFKYFINKMHSCGIGVILDWVPAHFPKDESGLADFDGGKCYEYQGEWKSEHKAWGTRCFDTGRPEVQSFLISNALFWLREFHVDGLRIDAVASMLYLDYDRQGGEWVPNTFGNNQNLEAVAFFKKLNSAIHSEIPRAIIIAEESTEWKNVVRKDDDFGLGFDLKWNMGWMHDTLDYLSMNPFYRKDNHNKLTFSFFYAFSERFVLPISHDEVVHGKKSLLHKFHGDYLEKFDTFRVFYSYMIAHPGKKMTFMGCEFGQFSEWNYEKGLEWFMTDFEKHRETQEFVRDANMFYLKTHELWEKDFSWEGFQWIVSDDNTQNIIAFERYNKKRECVICIFNFSPIERNNYRLGADIGESYKTIFSTSKALIGSTVSASSVPSHSRDGSVVIDIPAYSGIFLKKSEEAVII